MNLIYRIAENYTTKKKRPDGFSKIDCLKNCLAEFPDADWTIITDGISDETKELISDFKTVETNQRSNRGSFQFMLEFACQLEGQLYLVEDDYWHKPGSFKKIQEGFEKGFNYITLYDHPQNQVSSTEDGWCRIRTTTGTFATTAEVLKSDKEIFIKMSNKYSNYDFWAFDRITQSKSLGCPVRGYSNHLVNL